MAKYFKSNIGRHHQVTRKLGFDVSIPEKAEISED